MGYGYAETFLIVFLTHPGVIIPSMSTLMDKIPPGTLNPEVMDLIPPGGAPPIMSGLWQALWVWILSLPGEKSEGLAWTMYALYLLFLFVYMYYVLRMRVSGGW